MKFINTANRLDYNKNYRFLLPQAVCGSGDWKLIGLKHSVINYLLENADTPIVSNPAYNPRGFFVIYRDKAKTAAEELREAYGSAVLANSGSSILKGVNYLKNATKAIPLYSYVYRKVTREARKMGKLARNFHGSQIILTLSAQQGAYRDITHTLMKDNAIIQCPNGTTFGELAEMLWRGDLGHAVI